MTNSQSHPDEPKIPEHARTERQSESETMEQSPYVWIGVIVVVVLLVVIGLLGYAFEVF